MGNNFTLMEANLSQWESSPQLHWFHERGICLQWLHLERSQYEDVYHTFVSFGNLSFRFPCSRASMDTMFPCNRQDRWSNGICIRTNSLNWLEWEEIKVSVFLVVHLFWMDKCSLFLFPIHRRIQNILIWFFSVSDLSPVIPFTNDFFMPLHDNFMQPISPTLAVICSLKGP